MPEIGEVLVGYPRGYGRCQCGCRALTDRLPGGSYDKYVADHDSLLTVREVSAISALIALKAPPIVEGGSVVHTVAIDALTHQLGKLAPRTTVAPRHTVEHIAKDTGKRQDDRLVNMYADLNMANLHMQSRLDCLHAEVSFAIKYVEAFWRDNPAASKALIARLKSALATVEVQKKD